MLKNQMSTWCQYKVYKLLTWTLWPFLKKKYSMAYYDYIHFLTLSIVHEFLFQTLMLTFLVLTICFSWDLRLTIVNPLYPSKKRLRLYILICILCCITFYTYEYFAITGSIFEAFKLNRDFELAQYIMDN